MNTMTKMTGLIAKYISTGGGFCPFCNTDTEESMSEDSIDLINVEYYNAVGTIEETYCCNRCGKKWTDIYRLMEVIPYETV